MPKYTETGLKGRGNYKEFGKFMINTKLLYDGILLVKYKESYAPVYKIKRQRVSEDFVDELIYIFDTQQLDYEKLRELSNEENNLFKTLIMSAGLYNDLKYNFRKTRSNVDDILEEYSILKGEIEADNDNPDLIEKVRKVAKKLYHYGEITEEEYEGVL